MASLMTAPCAVKPVLRNAAFGKFTGSSLKTSQHTRSVLTKVKAEEAPKQVIQPLNGDPFIGMLETPVTSAPIVASFLSNLPAYRTGVSPLLRGVEIGLTHGFLVAGPFIKFGPLRNIEGTAEIAGCLSAAMLVLILTGCLNLYGTATFQDNEPQVGLKTLSGREVERDPLQSSDGWNGFTAGWLVGGLSGVGWAYICTQILPFYS